MREGITRRVTVGQHCSSLLFNTFCSFLTFLHFLLKVAFLHVYTSQKGPFWTGITAGITGINGEKGALTGAIP